MTQIHILDKDVKVAFNMATMIAYEQITDKAFNPKELDRVENRMALLYAAILSADRRTAMEMDELLQNANNTDIQTLDEAVSKEMLAFYKVPTPAQEPEDSDPGEEDLPKNV